MKLLSALKNFFNIFTNGLIRENPLLILMIGLCSSLAVTTSVRNGIGMGLSMTFVLLMSEVVISIFRKVIPASIRIPIFIIIIAAFTTVIDYTLKAWFPDLSKAMGVFILLVMLMSFEESSKSEELPLLISQLPLQTVKPQPSPAILKVPKICKGLADKIKPKWECQVSQSILLPIFAMPSPKLEPCIAIESKVSPFLFIL